MRRRVEVRDISAESGEKVQGFLGIGETPSGPLQIPVVIVNGYEDGPVLCLTAGVHGTEYAPIDAVMRIVQELQPAELRGAMIAVPVAHLAMYQARSRFVSPLDGLNLNKIAPGKRDGSISEVLAHVLLNEVIVASQYYIDLHAGDLGEMLMPFAGCALTGDVSIDQKGETLARLYSPKLISISTPESSIPPFPDGLVFAASRRAIVSIFAEAGGNGTLEEEDVRIHLAGLRNVMRFLEMIDGQPRMVGPRIAARDRHVVRAAHAGLLRLRLEIGDEVRAGQNVGEICNVFGQIVEQVHATGSGIAGLVWAHKVVNTGDPIFRYWVTVPA